MRRTAWLLAVLLTWPGVAQDAVQPLLAAARAAKQAGDGERAADALARVLELDRDCVEAHWILGWVLAQRGERQGAGREFREVVRLAPRTPWGKQAADAISRLDAGQALGDKAEFSPTPPSLVPSANECVLQGVTTEIDPALGRATLAISRVALAGGREWKLTGEFTADLLTGFAAPSLALTSTGGGRVGAELLAPGVGIALAVPSPPAAGPLPALPRAVQVAILPPRPGPKLSEPLAPDQVSPETVVLPLVFPVLGKVSWSDTFLAPRDGGKRRHLGQDLPAEKLRPVLACFDGRIDFGRGPSPMLTLTGDHGWYAMYVHLNNDTPGTDDDQGGEEWSIPRWLTSGQRVVAGQVIGWVGNSGNAKYTIPHLHFSLTDGGSGGVINAAPSLRAAAHLSAPRVRLALPKRRPERDEVRLDGLVREVDAARGVLVIEQAASMNAQGEVNCSRQPTKGWVKLGEQPDLRLLGGEDTRLEPGELRPGVPVTIFGRRAGEAVALRRALIDRSGLVPGQALARILETSVPSAPARP